MPPGNVIGSGLPIPGVYKEKQLSAEQAYQQALQSLAAEQRSTMDQYGFQGDVGDDGSLQNMRINPNQQFSLVNQMLRSGSASRTGLKNELAGRGLGKYGLSAQRKNLLKFLQQGDYAGLGQRFAGKLQGIGRGRSEALSRKQGAFNDAESEALAYALSQGLFNESAGSTGGAVGAGGRGTVGGETITGVTGNVFPNTPTVTTATGAQIPGGVSRYEQQFGNDFDAVGAQQALANTMAGVNTQVVEPPAMPSPIPQSYDPLSAAQQARQKKLLQGMGF